MKKTVFFVKSGILLIGAVFLLGISNTIFAHTTISDGTVEATLHIEPGDDPVTGTLSEIHFELSDLNHFLKFSNCNCRAVIAENGKTLLTKKLQDADVTHDDSNFDFAYTFPMAGMYDLLLSGTSTAVTPFQLHFSVKVQQSTGYPHMSWLDFLSYHSFHLLLFVIASTIGIVLTIVDYKAQKSKK